LGAYRNQDVPIDEILRILAVSRRTGRNTLFNVMFILQNTPPRPAIIAGLPVQFMDLDPGIARCDLLLELVDTDQHIAGYLEYSTDLFEAPTIARMATHLRTLLEAIVIDPEQRVSALTLLPASERKRLIFDWNETSANFGRLGTFSERFTTQVDKTPNAIAVSDWRVRLSYSELARRSSVMADRLAVEGVGPEVIVILLADRDSDLLAATIAVEHAGGAFLPVDPKSPAARLAHIIRHSGAPLVLVGRNYTTALEQALSGFQVRERPRILSLEQLTEAMPGNRVRCARSSPLNLAYVIYTSGSTGVPKGAMIERQGLVNHLRSRVTDYELSASDVVAQTVPQSFVVAVWQSLAPLLVGARVHICTDEEVRDPALLAETIAREGLTVLSIGPTQMRAILERTPNEPGLRRLGRLRLLISTGEALAPAVLRGWFRLFPHVPVINAYGASECSDDVATHRLTAPTSLATVPIGRPIANTRLYVLDAQLQPMPIGIAGELYVGGIGVGRGYLNDPEETRRRFLPDPFSKRRNARLYRTGDLARWQSDGTLEMLGRVDNQVKIRGYRVELGEIEHVLAEHPDVGSAVVLVQDDPIGEARLTAYVVGAPDRQPRMKELREFLNGRLPSYMIPAGFIFLKALPLNAHGKVNRSALPAIGAEGSLAHNEPVTSRESTERVLMHIWADLFKLEEIRVSDNFFDLGGHSLLAGQLLARVVTAFGVSLPIKVVFEAPTVETLARRIDQTRGAQLKEQAPKVGAAEETSGQPVSIGDLLTKVGLEQLNAKQRSEFKKKLKERRRDLKVTMKAVDRALAELSEAPKSAGSRKAMSRGKA
jgi:amino acid adenylation domain-containing protein